mgnify:FL=1
MVAITPELCNVIDAKLAEAGGLCQGAGNGKRTFCAEQLVAAVCGLPVNDRPECVEYAVQRFGIRINDSQWSSPEARAKGLRDFLIAQIGSKGVVNGVEFAKRVDRKSVV